MMMVMEGIFAGLLVVCGITLALSIYIGDRNNRVKDFKLYVLELVSNAAKRRIDAEKEDWISVYKLCDKHSYESMLYSRKPLTLEAWFTEDEIKILKGEAE